MKYIVLLFFLFLLQSCSRVPEGEVGIVRNFDQTVRKNLVYGGEWEIVMFDTMETIDITRNVVSLDNLLLKDSEKIMYKEVDISFTFSTKPEGVIPLYLKTNSISTLNEKTEDTSQVLAYAELKREAISIIQKVFESHKAQDFDREVGENEIKQRLQKVIDENLEKAFVIADVNIQKMLLNEDIESARRNVQITRNQQLEIDAQMKQVQAKKDLLKAELKAKKEAANEFGLTIKEFLDYEIKKEFNKAIEKNAGSVQLHIKTE